MYKFASIRSHKLGAHRTKIRLRRWFDKKNDMVILRAHTNTIGHAFVHRQSIVIAVDSKCPYTFPEVGCVRKTVPSWRIRFQTWPAIVTENARAFFCSDRLVLSDSAVGSAWVFIKADTQRTMSRGDIHKIVKETIDRERYVALRHMRINCCTAFIMSMKWSE